MEKYEGVVIFNFLNATGRPNEEEFYRYCFGCFAAAAGNDFMPYIKGSGVHQNCFCCGEGLNLEQHVGIAKYGHYSLAFHKQCFVGIADESFVPPCKDKPMTEERYKELKSLDADTRHVKKLEDEVENMKEEGGWYNTRTAKL